MQSAHSDSLHDAPIRRCDSRKPLTERFWARVDVVVGSCWVWTGAVGDHGYGRITEKGKRYRAHRMAWLINCGEIPEGLSVLHKCDNPSCVNPDHLFLGTQKVNIADGIQKGRIDLGAIRRVRTHCLKGHPLEGDNLLIKQKSTGGTERVCLTCRRSYDRQWKRNRYNKIKNIA